MSKKAAFILLVGVFLLYATPVLAARPIGYCIPVPINRYYGMAYIYDAPHGQIVGATGAKETYYIDTRTIDGWAELVPGGWVHFGSNIGDVMGVSYSNSR
jgi:hypothetical protein